METIWDHNPTDDELVAIFGSREDAERARNARTPDSARMDLAMLFEGRGQTKERDRVVASIEKDSYRFTVALYFAEDA